MRHCPNCSHEVPDGDFTCPYCHQRLPRLNTPISGHASSGDLDSYNAQFIVSTEDKNMIRDKNHSTAGDGEDIDCAQPYSYVTHDNGDRD